MYVDLDFAISMHLPLNIYEPGLSIYYINNKHNFFCFLCNINGLPF